MKKIILSVLLFSNFSVFAEEIMSKYIYESENLTKEIFALYNEKKIQIFVKKENINKKLLEFTANNNVPKEQILGVSTNAVFFVYFDVSTKRLYFINTDTYEKIIIKDFVDNYNIEKLLWDKNSNDQNFVILTEGNSRGVAEICNYINLQENNCFSRLGGDVLYPDEFDIDISENNSLLIKTKDYQTKKDTAVWEVDFSGAEPIKIAVIRDGEEIKFFREFSDLSEDDEMFAIVQQAVTAGWISGYDDGTIGLEKEINRAEFAKILIKAFGFDTADKANLARFSDVIETEWYYDTLAQAVSLGLMKGYSDSTIKPAQTINSVEAMKMVSEIFSEKKNLDEKFAPARRGGMISESEQWFTPYENFLTENLAKICIDGFCGAEAVFSNKKYEDKMTRGNAILLISLLLNAK